MLSTRSNINTTASATAATATATPHVPAQAADGESNKQINPNPVITINLNNQPVADTSVPAVKAPVPLQASKNELEGQKKADVIPQQPDESKESSTTTIADQFHKSEMDIFNVPDDKTVRSDDYLVKHINFKLSDVPDTQQFAKEVQIDKSSDKKIIVNLSGSKFNFYDDSKKHMGSFTVDHLIRFIGEPYDVKKQFMRQINPKDYSDAKELIENFVCTVSYDPKIGYATINLKSHNDSAFMGDVEMIVKLNKFLQTFVKSKLQDELKFVDQAHRKRIEHIVNQFMYMMLNYTMGLIEIVSSEIKDNPNKKGLALELVKYSIGTMYRISKFVQEQLVMVVGNNKDIEKLMLMSVKMRSIMDVKLTKLLEQVELQNSRLAQAGGASDEDDSSEIVNLNSSESESSYETSYENSSIELSRSVSIGKPYNFDAESHFSAILDI